MSDERRFLFPWVCRATGAFFFVEGWTPITYCPVCKDAADAGVSLRALEMAIQGAGYVPAEDVSPNPLTLIQIEGDAVVVQKLLGD